MSRHDCDLYISLPERSLKRKQIGRRIVSPAPVHPHDHNHGITVALPPPHERAMTSNSVDSSLRSTRYTIYSQSQNLQLPDSGSSIVSRSPSSKIFSTPDRYTSANTSRSSVSRSIKRRSGIHNFHELPPSPSSQISDFQFFSNTDESTPRSPHLPSSPFSIPVVSECLPEPEVAYSYLNYYTDCPHTSPPSSRPLNVQPKDFVLLADLLVHPPDHIKEILSSEEFLSGVFEPTISTIEGKCSICDHSTRREAESITLAKYARQMSTLQSEQNRVVVCDMTQTPRSSRYIDPSESDKTAILENQILDITSQRDREVKGIWSGYTQRWGPGTIRVHRDLTNTSTPRHSKDRSGDRRSIMSIMKNVDGIMDEGRMVVDWVRPDR